MRPRDRAALILLTLALGFACLAIGGALRWSACIAAGLGVASALPYLRSRRTATRPTILLLPLCIMAGLTLVQLVPLPIAIAEVLVPSKVSLVRENARAWGEAAPTWVLASFDPPATLVELAKLAGYLGIAWTAVRLASERQARRWLIIIVVGVAAMTATITLAHVALHTRRVYGVYQTTTNLDFVGPVVSANHLASLLALTVPLASTLALQSSGTRRAGWFAIVGLLTATTLLSGSRGGVIGLFAGGTITAAVLFVQRRSGSDESRPVNAAVSTPAALVAGAAIVVLFLLTAGDVTRDLSRTTLDELAAPESKFQVWQRAGQMTAEHRWLGVGKGGFEAAFTPHAQSGATVYSHAENSYLQTVVDWGVPGAALIFLAMTSAAVAGLRRWRKGVLEAGVLGAVTSLAVHDLADFSIELPAVAMPVLVASALLFPERLASTRKNDDRDLPRNALGLRAACLGVGFLAVALAASPLGRTATEDYERVTWAPASSRLVRARNAMDRHPASFLIAGRAAETLFAARDPRALKLIARALTMSSNHAGLRHLAARMLVVTNHPEQAAGEFAAAARLSRDVRPVVTDVLRAFQDPELIADALPTERGHAAAIIRVLGSNRVAALAYAKRVGQVHPRDAEMQALLAEAALEASDGTAALPAATTAWERSPVAGHAVLLGRALTMTGARDRALMLVKSAEEKTRFDPVVERIRLMLYVAELHVAQGDFPAAKAELERCRDLAASERSWLGLVHQRLAEVEDRLGNRNQAAWERARARELEGDR